MIVSNVKKSLKIPKE